MPFNVDQFYAVFSQYNYAVWPAQYVLFVLAALAVYFAALPSRKYDRIACAILAFFWMWTAIAYHAAFFTTINPAAWIFAIAFFVEAALLWQHGVAQAKVELQVRNDAGGWAGSLSIVYALLAYPLLSGIYGHVFPQAPTFGVPCPTTIFTIGLLLWVQRPYAHFLLIIPVLWAVVGTFAATSLDMPPDYGLTAAALAALGIVAARVARGHALHLPVLRL